MTLLFDTRYLFVRSLKKLFRNPILLFFSLFQPIIFLVLFTQLFHSLNLLPGFPPGVSYLEYASAGILLQNAFSSALQSGTSIVEDLNSGFLQKMLVTQVSRPAILLGRLTTDAFRVTVQSAIILCLAYVLGFRIQTGVLGLLLILFIVAFFGLAWSGISLALGLRTKSAETVFGIGAFLTFPLLFMSTALVPVGFMPTWMQSVSNVNPISYAVNAVRDLSLPNYFSWSAEVSALAFIAGIAVVTMGITLYLFKKVVS
ncbi:MAG: ABC transporter permease [Nitrososphaerota archaeon]|nr:ABC transporter permease [Nitrososphaerota archaeon]